MQLVQTEPIGPRVVDVVDFSDLFLNHGAPTWRAAQHAFDGASWTFSGSRTYSLTSSMPVLYQFSDDTYGVSAVAHIDAALEALSQRTS